VTNDGVTASGYGAENAWEVRAVRYSPVGELTGHFGPKTVRT